MIQSYIKLFFVAALIVGSYTLYGQAKPAADSSKTKDSTTLSNLSSKVDEILTRIKNNSADASERVGILSFDTARPATIYTGNAVKTTHSVMIDSVTCLINDGYIVDIHVYAGGRVFTNVNAPITMSSMRFSDNYIDLLKENNGPENLLLQECIRYEQTSSFYPEDNFITLTRKVRALALSKNVGVNTVLDLRIYTDALAAFGKEPNGIAQTDIRFKQFIHHKHFLNTGMISLQYFKLNFTASKLDSKRSFVDSSNHLSRIELLQRSKINAELLLNIFKTWLEKKSLSNFYIDFGVSINSANLATPKDTSTIILQNLLLDIGIDLKASSNIGFNVLNRFTVQYSPQTSFDGYTSRLFQRLGGEVYWNPAKEPSSRLFGRVNYTFGWTSSEKKNSFFQVQIGYSTLLSKVIGK